MPHANTYTKLLLNGGWTIPLRTRSWMNWLPCVFQLLRALQGPFLFSVAFSSPPLCCQRYFNISFKNNQRNIAYCTCGCTLKQPLQTLLECSSVPPPSGVLARYFAGGSHCCGRGYPSLDVSPPWPLQFKDWLSNLNRMCEAYSMSACAWGLLCRSWHMQEHIHKKLKVFYRLWPASQIQIHINFYQFCCSSNPIHAQT